MFRVKNAATMHSTTNAPAPEEEKEQEEEEETKLGPSGRSIKKRIHRGGELTGDSAEVEVVPDDLLQLVVHRAFLEAQVEVVSQVLVDHSPWRSKKQSHRVRNQMEMGKNEQM